MKKSALLRLAGALAAWVGLCASLGTARAEKVALVIGNNAYTNLGKLNNAVADAKAYSKLLAEKGYKVTEGFDLSTLDMNSRVAEFADSIRSGDTAVFAYAGHGWSDRARNYIIGTDAPATGSVDLLTRISIPLRNDQNGVLDEMERKGATFRVAIIDACRDFPFKTTSAERGATLQRGMLRMSSVPTGTFVVFSAGEGQAALDRLSETDVDPNGVFTRVFVPLLSKDYTLTDAIDEAQAKVEKLAREVGKVQRPFSQDNVDGRPCLVDKCTHPQALAAAQPPVGDGLKAPSDERLAALLLVETADADRLRLLVATLPDGALKERAHVRLEELSKREIEVRPVAPVEPPKPPQLVAKLTSPNEPPVIPKSEPSFDVAGVTKSLESELRRVGCYEGQIEPTWSPDAMRALSEFNRRAGAAVRVDEPTPEAVRALQSYRDNFCERAKEAPVIVPPPPVEVKPAPPPVAARPTPLLIPPKPAPVYVRPAAPVFRPPAPVHVFRPPVLVQPTYHAPPPVVRAEPRVVHEHPHPKSGNCFSFGGSSFCN